MKTLVLYYSHTGNNAWLAKKIAATLHADCESITPRLNLLPFLLLFSLIKKSPGIKRLSHSAANYDAVVLCGPIWMGQLIYPLRDTIKRCKNGFKKLYFVTCCGSTDHDKDGKFGYANVFRLVEELAGGAFAYAQAFPIGMVLPEDKRTDSNAMMKTRLSEENFTGILKQKFDELIGRIEGSSAR